MADHYSDLRDARDEAEERRRNQAGRPMSGEAKNKAWDLLAALKLAREEIIDLLEAQIGREVTAGDKSPRLIKVENAIAKAEGRV